MNRWTFYDQYPLFLNSRLEWLHHSQAIEWHQTDITRRHHFSCKSRFSPSYRVTTGNVTKHLCHAFPNAKITGVDSSPHMIEAAQNEFKNYSSDPKFANRVDFKLDTIENYVFANQSQKYDLVYSNATLHWIPTSYHAVLFPQIIKNVLKKNNSILAVQMPDTKNQQSHLLMETGELLFQSIISHAFCSLSAFIVKCRSVTFSTFMLHSTCIVNTPLNCAFLLADSILSFF